MAAKPASGGGGGTGAALRVTQIRSTISHIARNRATVRALGLRGIGTSNVVPDNDATRGMVRQVRFLVSVEELGGTDGPSAGERSRDVADSRSESRGDAPARRRSQVSTNKDDAEETA